MRSGRVARATTAMILPMRPAPVDVDTGAMLVIASVIPGRDPGKRASHE
jgi:hypothetical protein